VKRVSTIIVYILLVCATANGEQPKTHMTKREAMTIALRAIDARFPGEATGHSFDAYVRDGVWAVLFRQSRLA